MVGATTGNQGQSHRNTTQLKTESNIVSMGEKSFKVTNPLIDPFQ